MQILHVSAECFPAAKVGGLADVVGALPKYLTQAGCKAGVIIPKYQNEWIARQVFFTVYSGAIRLHNRYVLFSIEKEGKDTLGFPLFVANIKELFDRPGIYHDAAGRSFSDEVERYLCFQQAVLQWILHSAGKPSIIHCHDHHTGLIPFMVKHCQEYQALSYIPTVLTIHNGMYQGAFGWDKMYLLPPFEPTSRGLLDWGNAINPLATGIKCAWRITTVSPTYLEELKEASNGLEMLIAHEWHKTSGIVNGIDTQVWDPATDQYLTQVYQGDLTAFKRLNKQGLARRFHFDPELPLFIFIGRLVREKGADLIPDLIRRVMNGPFQLTFLLLGTGEPSLMDRFDQLKKQFPERFLAVLSYDEALAHQLYAGADFLFMPSRVEPCGLNQLYAMRYATVPVVRTTGGLKDTVPDIAAPDGKGCGIRFDRFNLEDAQMAIYRARELYLADSKLQNLRKKITKLDFSWEHVAKKYVEIYNQML